MKCSACGVAVPVPYLRRRQKEELGVRAITKDRIAAAFALRLKTLKGSDVLRDRWPRYTRVPSQNLVPGIAEGDFADDLRGGDGGELVEGTDRPAKFCAAHSSSALAVNTFAPLRRDPTRIVFPGLAALSHARFEGQCENGLVGKNPNLDFLAHGATAALAVESKCLELFDKKTAGFSKQYEKAMARSAETKWAAVYESLQISPHRFEHVDAVQLVKHYLGLQRAYGASGHTVVLLYVFWEPRNAQEFAAYSKHRDEVALFSQELFGSSIAFVARSYRHLWAEWESCCLASDHVLHLRERYDFDL